MAEYSTVNLGELEKFGDKLLKQQESIAIEKAVEYAKNRMIEAYNSSEYWRRTGNLDDSFCWIVCYKGEKKAHGFLEEMPTANKSYSEKGTTKTGRGEAEKFIAKYTPEYKNGLEIVFAATTFYASMLEYGNERPVKQVLMGIKDMLNHDFGLVNVLIKKI